MIRQNQSLKRSKVGLIYTLLFFFGWTIFGPKSPKFGQCLVLVRRGKGNNNDVVRPSQVHEPEPQVEEEVQEHDATWGGCSWLCHLESCWAIKRVCAHSVHALFLYYVLLFMVTNIFVVVVVVVLFQFKGYEQWEEVDEA